VLEAHLAPADQDGGDDAYARPAELVGERLLRGEPVFA
jgi:hypothetical protein